MRNNNTQKLIEEMENSIKELQNIKKRHLSLSKPTNQGEEPIHKEIRQSNQQNSNRFLK